MSNTIENLYYGNINYIENFKIWNEETKEARKKAFEAYQNFCRSLSEEQRGEFEKMMELQDRCIGLEHEQYFIEGFKLGAKILVEVFEQK